ncbi:response regulator transcription factor [Paractinoplanes ferrugineus]|uniref:response regulator transcription factor n=1 Tax=Paractinoplanes ferrugineus TaxID=113564 RepID=UPI001944B8E8|nr:response regulator transcription factor [Actinoplanes ferrugineus]
MITGSRDHVRIIREAVGYTSEFVIIAEVPAIREAVTQVLELEPEIFLLGTGQDGQKALELARLLQRRDGAAEPIIVLISDATGEDFAEAAALSRGVICDELLPEFLIPVLRLVADGYVVMPPDIRERVLATIGPADTVGELRERISRVLSPRELEIVMLVARGQSNAQISAGLHLSEATVKSHIHRISEKLQVRNRIGIVLLAIGADLLHDGIDP